jgi:curved DNA-binding protein CbpA
MKNHYRTLEVEFDATQEEIKKSYRKLALKFHPDKNTNNLSKSNRFIEIQEAYRILSDIQKRKIFDKLWLIYFEEQKPYSNSVENVPKIQDGSHTFIALAAVAIIGAVFLSFYFMTHSRSF